MSAPLPMHEPIGAALTRRQVGTALLGLAVWSPHGVQAQAPSGWAPYLSQLLNNPGGGVKAAAMYGQDGARWATSSIEARPGEVAALVAGLNDVSKFQRSGIVYGGVKHLYVQTRAAGGVLGQRGALSILVRKTVKAVLIVLTNDGVNPASITSLDLVAADLINKRF